MSPFCYFTFSNYIYSINFYICPRSSSTHNIYSEQYGSHIKNSHVILFVWNWKLSRPIASNFIKIFSPHLYQSVWWFRCSNATDRHTRTHEQHGDVKSLHCILYRMFLSIKSIIMLLILLYWVCVCVCGCVCVCVRWICLLNHLTE